MNKKEIITPFLIAALSVLFATICFMLFLSGGNSKRWIGHKIKIGAILLSLSAISSCRGFVSCYEPVEPKLININGSDGYSIDLDLDSDSILKGNLYLPEITAFSFAISDLEEQKKQADLLIPDDGNFRGPDESFSFKIDKTLENGRYIWNIFECDVNAQDSIFPFKQFYLNIKHE